MFIISLIGIAKPKCKDKIFWALLNITKGYACPFLPYNCLIRMSFIQIFF